MPSVLIWANCQWKVIFFCNSNVFVVSGTSAVSQVVRRVLGRFSRYSVTCERFTLRSSAPGSVRLVTRHSTVRGRCRNTPPLTATPDPSYVTPVAEVGRSVTSVWVSALPGVYCCECARHTTSKTGVCKSLLESQSHPTSLVAGMLSPCLSIFCTDCNTMLWEPWKSLFRVCLALEITGILWQLWSF